MARRRTEQNQEQGGNMNFMPAGAGMVAQMPGAQGMPAGAEEQRRLVSGMEREMGRDGYTDRNRTEATGISLEESPVRSAEAEDAYQLGQRMGAQSIVEASGIREPGAGAGAAGGANLPRPARMTRERILEANALMMKYKAGKSSVEARIIHAQNWWKLRNWNEIELKKGTKGAQRKKSATAWLWNCIVGKHADAMDSFPEPVILPRMQDDKEEATRLSEIVPVVLQLNGFENCYSQVQWQKMQEGTGGYGIFWDKTKLNGMGDISVRKVNLLNLYWEPGINDIQDSRAVFYVTVMDKELVEAMYPQTRGKLANVSMAVAKYQTDDAVSMDGKCAVVDWYYHTWEGGRKILQYCKYVGDEVLYSTEDSGNGEGLYEDGLFPFVLDPLFPVEGSPAGYGYIDVGKDAQADIDTLNQAMVLNAVVSSTPRYFFRKDGGVNEDEFLDVSRPVVHVGGSLGTDTVLPVQASLMNGNAMNMLQQKIDELKFVTGNTDINNGGTPSGVTAASAIAALKEDSGRSSKDSTKSSYRAYAKIVNMIISRIRQFYDIPRQFRILGERGQEEFVTFGNEGLVPQAMPGGLGMEVTYRLPVFDIDVRAQRENAYTKMSQNELALQFYNSGMFNPQMTDQVLVCLDMMDFKGKDEILQKVQKNGTMQEALMQVGQIALQLAADAGEAEITEKLAAILQGIAGDQAAMGAMQRRGGGSAPGNSAAARANDAQQKAGDANENTIVRKARERSEQATRPD